MKTIFTPKITLNSHSFNTLIIQAFLLFFLESQLFAQEGLEGIIVEKIQVTEAALADDANLSPNAIAYRVFVDLATGFEMQAVYAEAHNSITFNTTTKFYNHADLGGTTGKEIFTSLLTDNPSLAFDSYITVNAATNNRLGILIEEDTTDGMIDGLFTGTALSLQSIGAEFDRPFGYDDYEGLFDASDCAYNVNGGEVGPTSSNRVMIGQFTTDGEFAFKINIQIRKTGTGIVEQYSAAQPIGLQYQHPELHYPGPNVQITAPLNGSTVPPGYNLNVECTASNFFGISHVDFYVDELKVGTDSSAPYKINWLTGTEGFINLKAVATDSLNKSDSSVAVISIRDLAAPSISITSPTIATTVDANKQITITAEANDEDGTISVVKFYAGDVLIGEDQTAPYEVNWTPTVIGSVVLHASAEDNDGLVTLSASVTITVDKETGLSEMDAENAISIYPNPAGETLMIIPGKALKESGYKLEIINIQGKTIIIKQLKGNLESKEIPVDISRLSKGMYHIRITNKNGDFYQLKFLKN